jgi:hypothetical protein
MARSAQARPKAPASIPGDGDAIRAFFKQFASALTRGDGPTLSTMFAYPALAIANDLTMPINTAEEAKRFFGSAPEQYKRKGIVDTRADIRNIHWNTDRIATVEVDWPYIDAEGNVRGSESSTYVMHLDARGTPQLQVLVMEGERPTI